MLQSLNIYIYGQVFVPDFLLTCDFVKNIGFNSELAPELLQGSFDGRVIYGELDLSVINIRFHSDMAMENISSKFPNLYKFLFSAGQYCCIVFPDINMVQNRKKTSLKRKMVFYFLLVAFANVFVGFELLMEIKSERYRKQVIERVVHIKSGEESETSIFELLDNLTRKFFIMVGILVIVSAVILFLFVIQIASPIQYMINEAKKIAGGDLSVNLNMKSKDEISDLGNVINDLTVNLQEIIVQLQRMHANFEEAATCLESKLSLLPELHKYFELEQKLLKDNVENIAMIKQAFIIYQMRKFIQDDFSPQEKKLMDGLLENGAISDAEYKEVLAMQKIRGGYAGAILKELGYIDSSTLLKHLDGE